MKTKQEQVYEIMEIIANGDLPLKIPNRNDCIYRYKHSAIDLYKSGYRKATEVIDEFVERLKQDEESVKIGNEWKAVVRYVDIERIAAEMRQEVEK